MIVSPQQSKSVEIGYIVLSSGGTVLTIKKDKLISFEGSDQLAFLVLHRETLVSLAGLSSSSDSEIGVVFSRPHLFKSNR